MLEVELVVALLEEGVVEVEEVDADVLEDVGATDVLVLVVELVDVVGVVETVDI